MVTCKINKSPVLCLNVYSTNGKHFSMSIGTVHVICVDHFMRVIIGHSVCGRPFPWTWLGPWRSAQVGRESTPEHYCNCYSSDTHCSANVSQLRASDTLPKRIVIENRGGHCLSVSLSQTADRAGL